METLKLTVDEYKLLKNLNLEARSYEPVSRLYINDLNNDIMNLAYGVEISNSDKFREFLNDEIDKCFPTDDNGKITQAVEGINVNVNPESKYYEGSESQKQDNLKSILNKLN